MDVLLWIGGSEVEKTSSLVSISAFRFRCNGILSTSSGLRSMNAHGQK